MGPLASLPTAHCPLNWERWLMDPRMCPSRGELAAFCAGNVTNDSFETLAEHLKSCALCLTVVEQFTLQDDALLAALRTPAQPDGYTAEPQCEAGVTRLAAALGGAT